MSTTPFETQHDAWADRVRESFAQQGLMATLGARIDALSPGEVTLSAPFSTGLSQQNGFFHAGVSASLADSAGGYAAFTLFPADADVLAVEFKINLLRPANGQHLRATGRVIKPGRTLTVTECEVHVQRDAQWRLVAKMQQTLFCARP